ncbi:probable calcium-binding protein CML31 [Zingiber officinale]|uniref:EF-hand domain-containing protein n=1 Tax=Zingiber officinale TaxID=94328 RepID=A0A8J5EWM4_ZINOF|nr:probable calcium-binding protein CML31 [Zingiber officinale]XP_042438992.1 probable calcium-binding protein CML31 [Zingiber officinale]KAG6475714.1 hypothetical protein ZIOFF_064943 [Zingiber officinale]KAG6478526.1 hypothetical protein ZIOFF_061969 [Zingiber officinale]
MDLRAVFQSMDKDGDGRLSAAELALCVATTGAEFSLEDAEALVGVGGSLDFEAFEELAAAAAAEPSEEEGSDGELRAAFTVYEQEGEGGITPWSLRRTLSRLGERRDIDECRSMICSFDLDGDGVISFDEFRMMMMAVVVQSS